MPYSETEYTVSVVRGCGVCADAADNCEECVGVEGTFKRGNIIIIIIIIMIIVIIILYYYYYNNYNCVIFSCYNSRADR